MENQGALTYSQAEAFLKNYISEKAKNQLNNDELESLSSIFIENSFDTFFVKAERTDSGITIKKDENGRIQINKPAYRIVPKYNWAIHDSDLPVWETFMRSLIPLSVMVLSKPDISTSIIALVISYITQIIQPIKKYGVRLSDEQISVLLTLKILSKKHQNKVDISILLDMINQKQEKGSNPKLSKKELLNILISLKTVKHKNGTISKFADSTDDIHWWSVDV